jgi:PadR family transcriptional regulator, regulatory protein PadR
MLGESRAILIDIGLTECKTAFRMAASSRRLTLSAKEWLILELLIDRDHEMYGLELVAASRRRLKRGTVYVTLGRMEEKGYITSHAEPAPPDAGGLPRRLYQPTTLGRRVLSAWSSAARELAPELAR